MNLSHKGAVFVRLHEGFVGRWYKDPVGIGTIGIGFTWRSGAFRIWWANYKPGVAFAPGATMAREEAEQALRFLFSSEYGKAVNTFLGNREVPQHVFDGMASPVYNLGPGSLKWKWAGFAKTGDYASAAKALSTTGTTAQGVKLAGLVRRRKEEALLLEHGIYTGVSTTVTQGEPEVIPAPTPKVPSVLRRGQRGPEVAALLRDLATLGFYDGKLDDIFGHGAEAAVLEFQRAKGLKADGYAGPVTLSAIAAARGITEPPTPIEEHGFWAWLARLVTSMFS